MIEPQVQPIIGVPAAWTPGTAGTITADVVRVAIESDADFARYRGKLAGRIALTQPAREVRMLEGLIVSRMGEAELEEAASTPIPRGRGRAPGGRGDRPPAGRGADARGADPAVLQGGRGRGGVQPRQRQPHASAGSGLSIQQQRPDGGTVFPSGGGSRTSDPAAGLPTVTLAVEHYNRMVRVLDKGRAGQGGARRRTRFHEEPAGQRLGFNIIAEIPGTDPALKDEVVLLGAHFDSVAASPGATDNATGSAAMMEAMRILKTVGVQAAPHDSPRAVGRRGAGAARARAPTSASTSGIPRPAR